MVDEAGQVATFGGINDCVMVHPEEVAAPYALLGISLLTHVSHHLKEEQVIRHKSGYKNQGYLSRRHQGAGPASKREEPQVFHEVLH